MCKVSQICILATDLDCAGAESAVKMMQMDIGVVIKNIEKKQV